MSARTRVLVPFIALAAMLAIAGIAAACTWTAGTTQAAGDPSNPGTVTGVGEIGVFTDSTYYMWTHTGQDITTDHATCHGEQDDPGEKQTNLTNLVDEDGLKVVQGEQTGLDSGEVFVCFATEELNSNGRPFASTSYAPAFVF